MNWYSGKLEGHRRPTTYLEIGWAWKRLWRLFSRRRIYCSKL